MGPGVLEIASRQFVIFYQFLATQEQPELGIWTDSIVNVEPALVLMVSGIDTISFSSHHIGRCHSSRTNEYRTGIAISSSPLFCWFTSDRAPAPRASRHGMQCRDMGCGSTGTREDRLNVSGLKRLYAY
ncbi:hypothetical protein DBV39_18135 [Orrella marina]|uniref:Uncharacterized protein n=1 Tax=Orrella marina TaxID=2163011 RepID=A0A2R4XNI5_9BURK|nr:hypothetical protein DBV39_18135 [Orrella marina]